MKPTFPNQGKTPADPSPAEDLSIYVNCRPILPYHRLVLLLAILLTAGALSGYSPQESQFLHAIDFDLFLSWLNRGQFPHPGKAGFSPDVTFMTFERPDAPAIDIELDTAGGRIAQLREVVILRDFPEQRPEALAAKHLLEALLFRLNAAGKGYAYEMIRDGDFVFSYGYRKGTEAFHTFWEKYGSVRIEPQTIRWWTAGPEIHFHVTVTNRDDFSLTVPTGRNPFPEREVRTTTSNRPDFGRSKARITESPVTIISPVPQEEQTQRRSPEKSRQASKKIRIPDGPPPAGTVDIPDVQRLRFRHFISSNKDRPFSRQLRNNQIASADTLLKNNFPDSELDVRNGVYHFVRDPYLGVVSEISLRPERSADGLYIRPAIPWEIKPHKLVLHGHEEIDTGNLSAEMVEKLAPAICHLTASHRVIGTSLFDFLLEHDYANTSLVVSSEDREFLQMWNYSRLLLLLHQWWKDRPVHFQIQRIFKRDGHIELQAVLLVPGRNPQYHDFADIRLHLDEKLKLDIAMMFLYPVVPADTP